MLYILNKVAKHNCIIRLLSIIIYLGSSNTVRVLTIIFPITTVTVAIVASVLSSIITYYCCVRSTRSYGVAKNTLSVTNQPAAADYETPVKSSGLEMKDNVAYGHVSVTTNTGTPAVVYESVQS